MELPFKYIDWMKSLWILTKNLPRKFHSSALCQLVWRRNLWISSSPCLQILRRVLTENPCTFGRVRMSVLSEAIEMIYIKWSGSAQACMQNSYSKMRAYLYECVRAPWELNSWPSVVPRTTSFIQQSHTHTHTHTHAHTLAHTQTYTHILYTHTCLRTH